MHSSLLPSLYAVINEGLSTSATPELFTVWELATARTVCFENQDRCVGLLYLMTELAALSLLNFFFM